MYLTCVLPNPAHPSTRQALGDCCDMHRNIMKLFPPSPDMRAEANVLYRILEEDGQTRLYIASAEKPDLSRAAWLSCGQGMRQRDLAALLAGFREGTALRFDLLAHPSKKVDVGRGNSARVFLRAEEDRLAWLQRQGEKNGFQVCACREDQPRDLRGKRATGEILFRAVRFTGILRITDAAAFRRGYERGIGPEKAYGMGMLLLRKG